MNGSNIVKKDNKEFDKELREGKHKHVGQKTISKTTDDPGDDEKNVYEDTSNGDHTVITKTVNKKEVEYQYNYYEKK